MHSSVHSMEQILDKAAERRIKNRESACLSRENKRREFMELEREKDLLSRENEILKKMLCEVYGSFNGVEHIIANNVKRCMEQELLARPEAFSF